MIVIEHQAPALLVGPEERHRAIAGIVCGASHRTRRLACAGRDQVARRVKPHVGNVLRTVTLLWACLSRRGSPLVRWSIADPGSSAAVEGEGAAVRPIRR